MSAEQVEIRRPVAEDRDAWLIRWQGYLTFYKTTLPDHRTDSLWQRLLDDEDPVQGRVALVDGQVVGLAHFFPQPNTWFGTTCYLNDVFVDPELRGGGIGRALINAVADEAKALGCHHVYWHTQHFNQPGRLLYDSMTGGVSDFVVYNLGL
ncbi:MAG: GNAT family N-acetyltransferase [Actinomycetota bacterium]